MSAVQTANHRFEILVETGVGIEFGFTPTQTINYGRLHIALELDDGNTLLSSAGRPLLQR
jgi:hypothetical protein